MTKEKDDLSGYAREGLEALYAGGFIPKDVSPPLAFFDYPPCSAFAARVKIPVEQLDLAKPGSDRTVNVHVTRVGNVLEYRVEDLAGLDPGTNEAIRFAMAEEADERLQKAMRDAAGFAWKSAGDARARSHAGEKRFRAYGREFQIGDHVVDELTQRCRKCGIDLHVMADDRSVHCGQEVIVDPADRRGFDAKPARARPWS